MEPACVLSKILENFKHSKLGNSNLLMGQWDLYVQKNEPQCLLYTIYTTSISKWIINIRAYRNKTYRRNLRGKMLSPFVGLAVSGKHTLIGGICLSCRRGRHEDPTPPKLPYCAGAVRILVVFPDGCKLPFFLFPLYPTSWMLYTYGILYISSLFFPNHLCLFSLIHCCLTRHLKI